METLFPIGDVVPQLDLHSLSIPPDLKEFLGGLSESGHLRSFFDHLVSEGVAADHRGIIDFLGQTYEKVSRNPRLKLALIDFRGPSYVHGLVRLFVPKKQSDSPDQRYRWQGTLSHLAISQLMVGLPPKKQKKPRPQMSLFGEAATELFCAPDGRLFDFSRSEETLLPLHENWPKDNMLARLADFRQEMNRVIVETPIWHRQVTALEMGIPELVDLLDPYFGPAIRRLRAQTDALSRYLAGHTLLSWTSLLLYLCQGSPRIIFPEVSVLPPQTILSGGRVDAVEVTHINGRRPTEAEEQAIRRLTQLRHPSIGHLKAILTSFFGVDIGLSLIDWKLPVGDGIKPCQILGPSDVQNTPFSHARQVQRYIALAALSEYLNCRRTTNWYESQLGSEATIVYPLPREISVHSLSMDPETKADFFTANIAAKVPRARRFASYRRLGQAVRASLSPNVTNGNSNHSPLGILAQPKLGPELESADAAIAEIVEAARHYVDPGRIVEIVGRTPTGEPKLLLHADRLLAAVESRKVQVGHAALPDHITVSCLLPSHRDSTPSLRVYFRQGTFHCFGCQTHGRIARHSLPADWQLEGDFERKSWGWHRRARGIVIPDETAKIMAAAQDLLAPAFTGSPAEEYLLVRRGILPDLARAYGIGYADDRLYRGLLDAGWDLDQLAEHGFVAFSPKVSSQRGIMPLLRTRRRYRTLEACRRPVRIGKNDVYGFPYGTLLNRLTAPLSFAGKITNFYGRAIGGDRRFAHRKLAKRPGIPQGGFNMGILSQPPREAKMSEAVIDSLTWIAMDYPDTIGFIGVGNNPVIEEVARCVPNIAIALDNDNPGFVATQKLMQRLRELDYQGGVRDFTAHCVNELYGFGHFKDVNEWWQQGYRP